MSNRRSVLAWALSFLRPHRTVVAMMSILLIAQACLGALQPWPLKLVIDSVLVQDRQPLPEPLGSWMTFVSGGSLVGLLVVIVIAGLLLQVFSELVSAYAVQLQVDTGQRMVYELRGRLFQHLQGLTLQHHVTRPIGDAIYRIDVDAYSIENLVISGLFPLATSLLTLLVMFGVLVTIDVSVALLSLTIVPFLFVCLRYYSNTLVDRTERVKELESKLIERLFEVFSAIRLVKGFAREAHETSRYRTFGDQVMHARVTLTWQESLFSVVVTAITVVGTALVVIVSGLRVLAGQMTVGDLTVVIAYLGAVYGPLSSIAHTTGQVHTALAGARRVQEIFSLLPEASDGPDAVDAGHITGDIRFEHACFNYPDGTRVLEDVSFAACPGEMVAIVGLTGAGKTTLVSLLPRFYDVTSGRVLVDGRDVRQYRLSSLRERIGIVLQDPVLFAGTIADNLRYGRLDATNEEMEAAARAAQAHDFITRLPEQYDTEIAEAGAGLSGGERQRLSVARAILKDAAILILDEPTSSLDALSEESVFRALKRLRSGRTTIVIAHRLSTVRDADRILVLDGGRIVAQGRHEQLLQSSLLYRRMCARLSIGRSIDEPESVDELLEATRKS